MKRILLLFMALSATCCLTISARVITPQEAQVAALDLVDDLDGHENFQFSQVVVKRISDFDGSAVIYVVNTYKRSFTGGRFVILDATTGNALAYGDGLLDENDIPEAMQELLDYYQDQIEYLMSQHQGRGNNDVSVRLTLDDQGIDAVAPLLQTNWGQDMPYNAKCKFKYKDNADSALCKTGCGATALAQLMKKWHHPLDMVDTIPGYITGDFVVDSLYGIQFDWANMLNSYAGDYTAEQADAVAWLMRYAGQAQEMNYGVNESGSALRRITNALYTFGYNASWWTKSSTDSVTWYNKMISELVEGHPIIYSARNEINKGHIFDVDGYMTKGDTVYFHINWGWNGSDHNKEIDSNGYFRLDNFTGLNHVWNVEQQMIVGICPIVPQPPEVSVDSTSLSFEEFTDYAQSKSFIVRGSWLEQNINLSISGDDEGVFSITPTTISPEQAAHGVNVTVSYSPYWGSGESSAVVNIESEVGSMTVDLVGKEIPSTTYIDINEDEILNLRFDDGHTKYAQTQTFNVTARIYYMLDNDSTVYSIPLRNKVTLNLNPHGASCPFTVSHTTITAKQAYDGFPVTVTYLPQVAGESTADITLSTPSAYDEPVVNLYGKANSEPAVRASASSLSFNNWHTGYEISDTIIVSAYHTSGDVDLSLDDPFGSFTISRPVIPADSTGMGVPVIVTYYPTEDGQHSATLTLTNPNAEAFTINLIGDANSNPSIEYDPASLSFEEYTGYTQTKSFMLKAYNLTQEVTLQVNGSRVFLHHYFVTPSVVSIEDAEQGAIVSVTYTPWEDKVGSQSIVDHPVSIGFTSSGVNVDDLPLDGHTIKSSYYISADSTSLSFSTTKGNPVSQTMNLTHGAKLGGGDDGGGNEYDRLLPFSYPVIDIDSVIKEVSKFFCVYAIIDGDEGFELDAPKYYSTELGTNVYDVFSRFSIIQRTDTVTVVFNPESNHKLTRNANLTFCASGAKPVTVALTGLVEINEQQGDANGDGVISIADVTALIDYLLSGDANGISLENADCNQDGSVTIADVTALIDYLLSGHW